MRNIEKVKSLYNKWLDDQREGFNNDEEFNNIAEQDKRLAFLSDYIFGLCTYDFDLDVEFGKDIFEVLKIIYIKANFKYIENEDKYKKFILVCNLLDKYKWIEWGTSIRGCWLNKVEEVRLDGDGTIILTDDFLKWFICDFINGYKR